MLFGLVCFLAGVAGIVCAWFGLWAVTIIGAALDILENVIEMRSGRQTNCVTLVFFVVVGVLVGLWSPLTWWQGLAIGICAESVIIGGMGYIMMISVFFPRRK